jgi:hypothetical protein
VQLVLGVQALPQQAVVGVQVVVVGYLQQTVVIMAVVVVVGFLQVFHILRLEASVQFVLYGLVLLVLLEHSHQPIQEIYKNETIY